MTPSEFRAARKRLGLSNPEMGEALGISAKMVSRYNCGHYEVPLAIELAIETLERRAQKDG